MELPTLAVLEDAARLVHAHMQPSPQLEWPLLSERCGCSVLVKHENHNPTGAFKVRGGLVYIDHLLRREPGVRGLVTATRGNHGQSVAYAAARHGLGCLVVVPEGNSEDKNRAMAALGAEIVVHGADFDDALPMAARLASERGWHRIPSFHDDLVAGVASYAIELLRERRDLERVYVPIGLGSGICGVVAARDALGLDTEIIGVVASGADCYARSLAAAACVETSSADTVADGVAVRVPHPDALAVMLRGVARIVTVDDDEILRAMAWLFSDTHNVAEGAAAAPLAALYRERELNAGAQVAMVLSGGNVDPGLYARALAVGAV
jgi:threonine dehydratase